MSDCRAQEPLLEFRNVSKVFETKDRAVNALRNVSIRLAEGERMAVLGRSGCGKSTLLRLAAGLERPSEGSVTFRGMPIEGTSLDRGIAFQEPRLLPWLTVEGNATIGSCRESDGERRQRLKDLLKLVGLSDIERAYPKELSGGMAQRVGLVRALYPKPDLLMLDEPMGALDITGRVRLQDSLLRLWESNGTSVLLVTHDIDEAVFLSHRMLIMDVSGGIACEMANPITGDSHRDSVEFNEVRKTLRASLSPDCQTVP